MDLASEIEFEAKKVNRNPTEAQKESGVYRKGHVRVHGIEMAIENPRGSYRRGTDAKTGKPWSVKMPAHYGYAKGTYGADGDGVDFFIGPHLKNPHGFVLSQKDANTGKFDEHKAFIGFASPAHVKNTYKQSFSDGRAKDRMGELVRMTIPELCEWVKSHKPAKRAAGGRVGMADGGVPSFDQTQPIAASGAPPFEQTHDVGPEVGGVESFLRGALQGSTFNFSDEMAGLRGASGLSDEVKAAVPYSGELVGGVRKLIGSEGADKGYNEAIARERSANKAAADQHPYLHTAGEIAGAIPAMAVLPGAGVAADAGVGARIAQGAMTGAEYGGLSGVGAGTDAESRVLGGAEGTLGGGAGGALAPAIGGVAGAAFDRFGKPIVNTVRGLANPEAEAGRRVATALRADQDLISSGRAEGMSPQDWIAARSAGEPVTLADLGSTNTQALLRSAANTSPDGRALLEKVINERFLGQSERVADTVRGLVAGGANAGKTADQLVAEYDAARAPAYKRAFQEGDKEIISPAIERLMGSPTFEQAMKNAVTSGKDRAITEGYGAFNPGVIVENGMLKFTKTKPNGVPTYPNLQYWDSVKKELDGVASVAGRAGDKGKAEVAGNMAKTLRGELDTAVPSYADARGVASQFFGESNALEAGRNLAGKRVDPQVISQTMRQMKPDERELFREGYASDWANRVIGNMSDTRDVTKAMFNSPNERERTLAVFGAPRMAKMQARMTLETIMDGARKAMGNSTTARQLIEAGLAGGVGGLAEGYATGWDPMKMAEAAGIAGTGRFGAGKFLASEAGAGARKIIGYVDSNTARSVADLLTSNDPSRLAQGLRMAQKNQRVSEGLRAIANRIALAGQSPASTGAVRMMGPRLQGPVPASAGNEQQQP